MDHYTLYRDLFVESVTIDTVVGFEPASEFLLLEVIQPEKQKSSGKIKTIAKNVPPLVFRVITAGDSVTKYKKDDLVLITFQAGDIVSAKICLVKQQDIVGKWGSGLLKPQEPAKEKKPRKPRVKKESDGQAKD